MNMNKKNKILKIEVGGIETLNGTDGYLDKTSVGRWIYKYLHKKYPTTKINIDYGQSIHGWTVNVKLKNENPDILDTEEQELSENILDDLQRYSELNNEDFWAKQIDYTK